MIVLNSINPTTRGRHELWPVNKTNLTTRKATTRTRRCPTEKSKMLLYEALTRNTYARLAEKQEAPDFFDLLMVENIEVITAEDVLKHRLGAAFDVDLNIQVRNTILEFMSILRQEAGNMHMVLSDLLTEEYLKGRFGRDGVPGSKSHFLKKRSGQIKHVLDFWLDANRPLFANGTQFDPTDDSGPELYCVTDLRHRLTQAQQCWQSWHENLNQAARILAGNCTSSISPATTLALQEVVEFTNIAVGKKLIDHPSLIRYKNILKVNIGTDYKAPRPVSQEIFGRVLKPWQVIVNRPHEVRMAIFPLAYTQFAMQQGYDPERRILDSRNTKYGRKSVKK